MKYMKRAWHYVFTEPCTWFFYCFFQPGRFRRERESIDVLKRLVAMLRLALPMFLCSYAFALLVHTIGAIVGAQLVSVDTEIGSTVVRFLLAIALATIVSIVWGVLWGIAGGIAGGIAWGITLSIAGGLGNIDISGGHMGVSGVVGGLELSTFTGIKESIQIGIIGGIIGIPGGIVVGIANFIAKKRNVGKDIARGIIGGLVGSVVGLVVGLIGANIAFNIARGIVGSIAEIISKYVIYQEPIVGAIAGSIAGSIARPIAEKRGTAVGIVGGIVGGIAGAIVGVAWNLSFLSKVPVWEWVVLVGGAVSVGIGGGIVGSIVLGIVETNDRGKDIAAGLMMLIAGGLFIGITSITITSALGITLLISMGLILGLVRPSTMSIILGITLGIGRIGNLHFFATPEGIKESLALIACFIVGYSRLPLYPISGLSALRTYLASRKNPPQVFTYLRRSSLYWDERVFLPLPGLKQTLLLAAEQDVEQALEEVAFIVAERPQQLAAARAASLEIAVHDLETRENLREIAQASQRLTDILPQEAGLIDPRWVTPFARLSDASRDAARACSPLGWQARRTALQEIIADLKKVYPNTAFTDAHLNTRLGEVVKTWRAVAQRELEEMEKAPEKTSRIENPYNPGPALELRDSLFVGRRDLAQQLGDALGKGSRRPTFLLQGERRMGKSSTLKQLPDLLGAKYLPIFYDLQTRGFSSSIAVFLGKIADEIYKVMRARGFPTKKLAYERLQEADRKNEAEVYLLFERWLEEIEWTLEQEDRTLLLTFDEFEKLEEAGQAGYFNLGLLLDWFRSVIQNHPRLALLFSGVRNFGDMGANWAGYFVNVQTLKITFLQPDEAHQLITRPVPNFPGEQIFGERVVEGIKRVTNCHPFLVQAVCSALLDSLNADKRNRIELRDVGAAANQVLKNWGSTYFRDLWERTDKDQRACVLTLNQLGEGDLPRIEQQSGLDGSRVHRVLETLIDRDIVMCEHGIYQIAVPLFGVWVQRSNYR